MMKLDKEKLGQKMNKDLILTVNNEIRLLIRDYKYAEDIVYLINKNKSFLRKTLGWIPENEYTIEDAKSYIKNTTFDEKFDTAMFVDPNDASRYYYIEDLFMVIDNVFTSISISSNSKILSFNLK